MAAFAVRTATSDPVRIWSRLPAMRLVHGLRGPAGPTTALDSRGSPCREMTTEPGFHVEQSDRQVGRDLPATFVDSQDRLLERFLRPVAENLTRAPVVYHADVSDVVELWRRKSRQSQ